MKNILKFTSLLVLLMLFTSCEKDSDSNSRNDQLEGDWTATSVTASVKTTTEIAGFEFVATTNVEGENLNYDLSFTSNTFETSGSYTARTNSVINGIGQPEMVTNITDIMGSGSYTSTDTELTTQGPFFTFDSNGMSSTASEDEQTVSYNINSSGILEFMQNETTVTSDAGSTSTTIIESRSTFRRK